MNSFKGKPCYFCGGPSDSAEHAPPKQMFRGFECDRITVPACEKHNSKKSGNDQAIVSALLIPLANSPGCYSLGEDVKKAIELAQSGFEYAKKTALNVPLVKNPSERIAAMPNISYLHGSAGIHSWVKLLTAALVHDAIGKWDATIKWDEAHVRSPDWIESGDPSSLPTEHVIEALAKNRDFRSECATFPWTRGWSAEPRPYPATIYEFHLNFGEREVSFWHRFYSQYSWYVAIGDVGDATLNSVRKKAGVIG